MGLDFNGLRRSKFMGKSRRQRVSETRAHTDDGIRPFNSVPDGISACSPTVCPVKTRPSLIKNAFPHQHRCMCHGRLFNPRLQRFL
ncbi:hypothetical protein D3C78_1430790 [compost metagenome]